MELPRPQGPLQARVLLWEAVLSSGLMPGGAEHQNHQEGLQASAEADSPASAQNFWIRVSGGETGHV